MRERTIALLVAAGKSERMQMDVPKPYLSIGEEALLKRTAKAFLSHPEIDGVRIVIRREDHPRYREASQGLTLFPPVVGGDSRQESVCLGLEALEHRRPEHVLVHDIARPLASHRLISRVIAGLKTHTAVIPALPITDTIKRGRTGYALETVPRDELYTVQTPQGFRFRDVLAAHQKARGLALTDDAAVMEHSGHHTFMVEGDADNIKITTASDIERMQTLVSSTFDTRVGMGYDVHVLAPHDADTPTAQHTIRLCGIPIAFTHYLVGHSDADVGLHALVDAILGAMGAGDIGQHFPPDEQKWKGADSSRFLLHAYELLTARGGQLVHLDITIICERPKVSPYREQMAVHVAQLLKLRQDRVSIKATTTEKLGFTGRGEGIAAHAIATIRLPRG